MTKAVFEKLDRAFEAIRELPLEAQAAIAGELERLILDFAQQRMNEAQRAEIKRRLAGPRQQVPEQEVRALLRRYNSDL